MGRLIIPDHTGHKQIDWAADKESVAEATKTFNDWLKKGYAAVAYHGDVTVPANGKLTREFDDTANEIKMIPNIVGG
jgi:hypothetical protein